MTPAVARRALPGLYLDTDEIVTRTVAQAVKANGYLGIIRYVPLPGNNPKDDITPGELEIYLEEGLVSWWVQHVRLPGWDPSQHDGEKDALFACNFAKLAGYVPTTHGSLDLEGIAPTAKRMDVIQYASDFTHVVVSEGFSGMIYMGYDCPLDPVDYWDFRDADQYWSDAAKRRVYKRGVSVNQGAEIIIAGTKFDRDTVAADNLGDTPIVTAASLLAA
jgi:hypothetical protein